MSDAAADARMRVLRGEWIEKCGERAEKMSQHAERVLAIPDGERDSGHFQFLADLALLREIASGKLTPMDCGHARRLCEAFMEWLRATYRNEWVVVAQWVPEEFRDENSTVHAALVGSQCPGCVHYEDLPLVFDILN